MNNFKRLGFTDADLTPPGSDKFIDALVAYGTPDDIANRLREHLRAGANHVVIQVLGGLGQTVADAERARRRTGADPAAMTWKSGPLGVGENSAGVRTPATVAPACPAPEQTRVEVTGQKALDLVLRRHRVD